MIGEAAISLIDPKSQIARNESNESAISRALVGKANKWNLEYVSSVRERSKA